MRDFPSLAVEFLQRRVQALRHVVTEDLKDLNRLITHVLGGGMIVSLAVLLAGLAIATIEGGAYPRTALEPGHMLELAFRLRPEGLLSLGVLLLVLTPVARVALSLGLFLKARDRTYVAITAIVLVNLLTALFFGFV